MSKSKKSSKKPKTTRISAKDEDILEEKVKDDVVEEELDDEDVEEVEERNEEKKKSKRVVDDDDDEDDEENEDDDEDEDDDDNEEDDEDEDDDDDEDDEEDDDDDEDDEEDDKKKKKVKKEEKVEKMKQEKKKVEKAEKVITTKVEKKDGFWKSFFAKKYEEEESVLTIFKHKKTYGAILGEVFGTMFISMVILTLGLYQPLYMFFIVFALSIAIHKLSGALLNPISTVGMMATRRISAVRGVLYLLSQLVGAWIGFLIVSTFLKAAAGMSESDVELPGMTMAAEGYYWVVTFLEFLGAVIIGFFFARAWEMRKNVVAFGAIVAGGITTAIVVVYLISYQNFGLTGNFMLNPAVALMYQILPTSADGVKQLLFEIFKALFTYVIFPMAGGVLGFYLSDASKTLTEE